MSPPLSPPASRSPVRRSPYGCLPEDRGRLRALHPVFLLLALLVAGALGAGCAGAGLSGEQPPAEAPEPLPEESLGPPDQVWTVLIQGNEAGEMTGRRVETGAPYGRVFAYTFEFNDRGRGPDLTSRLRLGADGTLLEVETTGTDYLGAPVDERFELVGGEASWSAGVETGQGAVDGPAYYVSVQSAHPDLALLARALLEASGNRLPLLPQGEAWIEDVRTLSLDGDAAAGSEPLEVTRVSLAGLGFAPVGVWLEGSWGADGWGGGGQGDFFAQVSGWSSVIRTGWEDAEAQLLEVETEATAAWEAGLGKRLAERPAGGLAFEGAAVFDARSGALSAQCDPGCTVLVEGDRITAVGPDGAVAIPEGARRIDARGKTLLPGLWDMHGHLSSLDGPLNLSSGVTAVRDLANDIDQLRALEERWETGSSPGPRVFKAGFMDGPGPFAGPTKVLVSTPEEARAAIDRYAELGYLQIKVYSSLDPELLPGIIERAHGHGLRVSGHVPQGLSARQAVEMGFDELQHVNFLFLNFWADEGIDTRTPARFTEVAARAADMDLGSPEVRSFIALLAERQVVVDPTVTAFEGMFTAGATRMAATWKPVAERFPPLVQRNLVGGGLEPPAGQDDLYRRSYDALLAMVKVLHDAGVPLVLGTDSLAGFALHREMELWARAGIPPGEILAMATLGSARVVGQEERLGSVEAGKLADLVLVDGNPVADISAVRRPVVTVRGGVLYDSRELGQALGIAPWE